MRACFAIALDTQMKHGGVKAKCFVDHSASKMIYIVSGGALNSTHSLTFVDHFVKIKVDAKVLYGTSLHIWLIKRVVR